MLILVPYADSRRVKSRRNVRRWVSTMEDYNMENVKLWMLN